jgi:putative flippase GtrA
MAWGGNLSSAKLSNILSVTNAYFFHKHITFRSDIRGVRRIYEYFRFSMTYLITFIFSMILLPILVELFHLAPQLAAALILGICTIVSYLGHSRFSFKRH